MCGIRYFFFLISLFFSSFLFSFLWMLRGMPVEKTDSRRKIKTFWRTRQWRSGQKVVRSWLLLLPMLYYIICPGRIVCMPMVVSKSCLYVWTIAWQPGTRSSVTFHMEQQLKLIYIQRDSPSCGSPFTFIVANAGLSVGILMHNIWILLCECMFSVKFSRTICLSSTTPCTVEIIFKRLMWTVKGWLMVGRMSM